MCLELIYIKDMFLLSLCDTEMIKNIKREMALRLHQTGILYLPLYLLSQFDLTSLVHSGFFQLNNVIYRDSSYQISKQAKDDMDNWKGRQMREMENTHQLFNICTYIHRRRNYE